MLKGRVVPWPISSWSCGLEDKTLNLLRQTFSVFQSVCDYAKGERLNVFDRILSGVTIDENPIEFVYLGNPPAVVLLFKFDC